MLEKALERGSDRLRERALRLLKQSQHFRTQRTLLQERPKPRGLMEAALDEHSPDKVRRVYNAKQSENLPGVLVRSEGDPPTGDVAVDEAYDGAGATWELYMEEYGRNSIDDAGMIIDSTVHYGQDFNNAFWDGEQMVYGDGDGELFTRFTIDLDVIAHELTHGVTQYEANLTYAYQSGALNESFSDVFGSLVKQRALGQDVNQADWLIGANVLVGEQYALRSMKAPGTAYVNHPILGNDPQPATMDGYQNLPAWDDNGGVHINSGIPNHTFYLAAMEIGGHAWEKAGLIWYRTLTDKLRSNANFVRTAKATIQVARERFGRGSLEEKAVTKAWKDVKVL
jgi:Zn-dependent metalloprotease